MQKLTLNIRGMQDAQCEGAIVANLKKLDGIFLVKLDFKQESGVITFDEVKIKPITIAKSIKSLGYAVTANTESAVQTPVQKKKSNIPKIVFGAVALLSLSVIGLELNGPTRNYIASHFTAQAPKKTGLDVLQEQTKSASSVPKTTGDLKSVVGVADSKTVADDVQKVTAELGAGGKLPDISVKVGQLVEFNLHVKDAGLLTVSSKVLSLPTFQIEQNLYVGDNIMQFTPDTKGTFEYSSVDGKLKATITVK